MSYKTKHSFDIIYLIWKTCTFFLGLDFINEPKTLETDMPIFAALAFSALKQYVYKKYIKTLIFSMVKIKLENITLF